MTTFILFFVGVLATLVDPIHAIVALAIGILCKSHLSRLGFSLLAALVMTCLILSMQNPLGGRINGGLWFITAFTGFCLVAYVIAGIKYLLTSPEKREKSTQDRIQEKENQRQQQLQQNINTYIHMADSQTTNNPETALESYTKALQMIGELAQPLNEEMQKQATQVSDRVMHLRAQLETPSHIEHPPVPTPQQNTFSQESSPLQKTPYTAEKAAPLQTTPQTIPVPEPAVTLSHNTTTQQQENTTPFAPDLATQPDSANNRWSLERQAALAHNILHGKTTIQQASQIFSLPVPTVECWVEEALRQMDNTVEPETHAPHKAAHSQAPQPEELQAAYGEAMLEIRMLKKRIEQLEQQND